MNLKLILYNIIKMVKDSKNSPIQIRQITYNKVLKMFSIYLIKKKNNKKKRNNVNSGFGQYSNKTVDFCKVQVTI